MPAAIVFTEDFVWIPERDMTVDVEIVGAGGGGEGSESPGRRGEPGERKKLLNMAVTAGTRVVIKVGARGNAGCDGGDTSFGDAIAKGGKARGPVSGHSSIGALRGGPGVVIIQPH